MNYMSESLLSSLKNLALGCGFTHTGELSVETLKVRSEVRDACAANKCGNYGKSWSCPPACGDITDCEKKMRKFQHGLILQTMGRLEDPMDYEEMRKIGGKQKVHLRNFLAALVSPQSPFMACTDSPTESSADGGALLEKFLILGSGSCKNCEKCSYPDSPCLFPEKMIISMEAMGLVVSEVCKLNNIPYYYGPNTLAYVGCVLF